MLKSVLTATVTAAALLTATAAQAGLILTGGVADTLPGNYNPNPPVAGVGVGSAGTEGGVLSLSEASSLIITNLGFEAGFTNNFFYNGVFQFSNKVSFGDTVWVPNAAAGNVLFGFGTNGKVAPDVINGVAFPANTGLFFIQESATSFLVFLDDSGAGPDADFDDAIIRIEAFSVPEPAAIGLVGVSLALGAGLVAFRRRRAA